MKNGLLKSGLFKERLSANRGFTLVEVLVAIGVLGLVLVLLMQVVGSVLKTYGGGRADAESYSTGRALLDAVGRDLQGAFVRNDLPSFPVDGNTRRLAFYTAHAGVGDGTAPIRDLSYVDYFLNTDASIAALMRADTCIPWNSLVAFGNPATPNPTVRTLSGGVLAFDYRFIMKNREISRNPQVLSSVMMVRVSMAVVDSRTMEVIQATSSLDSLKQDLSVAAADDSLISAKAAWEHWLRTSAGNKYKGNILGGLRFFERVVPINLQTKEE